MVEKYPERLLQIRGGQLAESRRILSLKRDVGATGLVVTRLRALEIFARVDHRTATIVGGLRDVELVVGLLFRRKIRRE